MNPTNESQTPPDQLSFNADNALQRLIGIETLKHSARLAGLAGGGLLLLAALVAWLGTRETHLDSYRWVWAALPALLAAFGGPLIAKPLLRREHLTRQRPPSPEEAAYEIDTRPDGEEWNKHYDAAQHSHASSTNELSILV